MPYTCVAIGQLLPSAGSTAIPGHDQTVRVTATDRPVLSCVDGINGPAYILDRAWNACWWNAKASRFFTSWLDANGVRNLLRYTFLRPEARSLMRDWPARAPCRSRVPSRRDQLCRRSGNTSRRRRVERCQCRFRALLGNAWRLGTKVAARTARPDACSCVPRIAPPDPVLPPKMLVKVLHPLQGTSKPDNSSAT